MKNRPTSPTARKWQRYNRWRSKSRARDQERRLERIAQRKADYVAGYRVPRVPVPRLKAMATVIIVFDSGERVRFKVYRSAHGLSVSPTLAGKRVATVLKEYQPAPATKPKSHPTPRLTHHAQAA